MPIGFSASAHFCFVGEGGRRRRRGGGVSLCSHLGMLMGITQLGDPQRCITQPWGLLARGARGWDASEPENTSPMGRIGQRC